MNKIISVNKFVILYLFSSVSLAIVVYLVPIIADYPLHTWADFYRTMGKLMGIWGSLFGASVFLFFCWHSLTFLHVGFIDAFRIKLTSIEYVFFAMFVVNIIGLAVGILRGEPLQYVLGDTLKGSFIPLFYLWAKKYLYSTHLVVSFTKLVLAIEVVLFVVFAATGFVPFAQSTRTFLYTVSFTLFFEENRFFLKSIYFLLTLFALYVVVTTQAVRGTIIIFFFIIILNVFLKYRYRISPLSVITGIALLFIVTIIYENSDITAEKDLSKVSNRFNETLKKSSSNKYGLEESVFQRVGETIDVFGSFQSNSPIYSLIGFGNGAMLDNVLMTPSEFSVYKSREKHNIYITLLGVLYRNGLIGLSLYVYLFYYLLSSIIYFYKNRLNIPIRGEYVYLKVLILYHFSVVLYSFVAYLFVGNVVVAFTIPLHVLLRKRMEKEVNEKIIMQPS